MYVIGVLKKMDIMNDILLKLKRITIRDGKKHSITIDQDEAREICNIIKILQQKLEYTEEVAMQYKEKYEELIGKLDIDYIDNLVK